MKDISTINKMLPIGVDIFEKLRKDNYYYVDKTGMIKKLLENKAEVTLFTRPRRFGKTLNMTMLKSFFSITSDQGIFEGLEITREKQLCLNQYLTEYRMEKAKQLLADPRYKITDISSRVGYSDGNYFGKSFKKYTGFSPSEYREKMS